MAQKIQPELVQPVATPQHYVPGTARELRAQTVHRLQVGLFGLLAMLLLVGLANIIMDRARMAESANSGAAATAGDSARKTSDPLADIGVVPAADPSASSAVTPNP
jgi:hypothetical protein